MSGKRKRLVFDLALIAGILILTAVFYFAFSAGRDQGGWAVVTVDGEEIARYPLSEDGSFVLNGGTNTLVIQDGKAWMSEASCPDKVCIGMGQIQYDGQIIVCLPNRLIVQIEGGDKSADIFVG